VPGVAGLTPLPASRFEGTDPLGIVYVGQISPHKGLDVLIDALPHTHRPHRLTVLGDNANPYGLACKEQAERLGVADRVNFLGKVPPETVAERTFASGEILVMPSVWNEPYSLVVLEGMALGMVVVASDTGGTAEAFTDGVDGFLFPRGDVATLAARIDAIEADRTLAARVSARARAESLRSHTQERMVGRLLDHSLCSSLRLAA
jgi:glycosyltransferase involved in cell wall biosynthesis